MNVWILRGPGPEMKERYEAARQWGVEPQLPTGQNTYEEAEDIAAHSTGEDIVYAVTSAYHVTRAYLTLKAAFKAQQVNSIVHVWGTGTITNIQMQSEAQKLAAAQAKGHALKWEDCT